MNLAFHFVRLVDGVPMLRDGRPMPAVGEALVHEGAVLICHSGLHASWRAIDALEYCPSSTLGEVAACLVEVDDVCAEQSDKLVCRKRTVLGWAPCNDLLLLFAREAALSVAQYWTMPPIVREYLETGNEEIRTAASDAASDAASYAARAAAWAAAGDAASDAARDAAWAAAWAAASDAATAARAAARAAAGAAAWAAAGDDLNALLESILLGEIGYDHG